MLRGLIHFWPMSLAVAAGAAVATAVLTGALVVGDSVGGSLRQLTLERLGGIDFALVSERFFSETLAGRLAAPGYGPRRAVAPAVSMVGSVTHADSRAVASGVQIHGIDRRFAEVFGPGGGIEEVLADLGERPRRPFAAVVVNQALAEELGASPGEEILLSLERRGEIPTATLLGEKDPGDLVRILRLKVAAVIPDRGVGRFGLTPHQAVPLNAFVPLAAIQESLGREGRVNSLLVAGEGGAGDVGVELLEADLGELLRPDDLGVEVRDRAGFLSVQSEEFVLRPEIVEAATSAARSLGAAVAPLLSYLANTLSLGSRAVPYSMVAALELPLDPRLGELRLAGGASPARLIGDQILLDRWTADELEATPGDAVEMTYFAVGAGDRLETRRRSFRVAGVVAMEGLAVDRTLTPELPGIAGADNLSAWDPPFPVDLGLIRPSDEAYWDEYRGAPKVFVPLATGRRLWRSRFGELTALRVAPPPGEDLPSFADAYRSRLRQRLTPRAFGLSFAAVRAQGLEAASGATDFSGLFLGFSLFLIVSAGLLVGLLFSLAVEQRGRELGLRLAVGYPARAVRWMLLAEGGVLAVIGAAAGVGLAVVYARWLVAGLGSWWAPLLGARFLALHLGPLSLVAGTVSSIALVVATVAWTLRRLRRVPARALLAGSTSPPRQARGAGWARLVAWGAAAIAAALLGVAAIGGGESRAGLFFAVGAALSAAGFAWFTLWCRRPQGGLEKTGARALMAVRNSARNPGRSLLSVVLVGCACFVLVAVAANRREVAQGRIAGTGGFELVAESSLPVYADLDRHEALEDLGLSAAAIAELGDLRIFPFRLVPGEDASCLNLYQPSRPRLLGAPPSFRERGGFRFRDSLEEGGESDPWRLLEADLGEGVVAAIADDTSARWILHLGLGDELEIEDESGAPLRLRIVGLLEPSIFQSELLISEERLLERFPSRMGYRYFLIEAEAGRASAGAAAAALEAHLSRYGLDASSTVEKLARYQALENVYLSTFQILGGLGLLLGTLGLGLVLIRNVIERRGELAALRAFGFRRRTLAWMVVLENGFLLLAGMLIGGLAGLIAVAPHLIAAGADVPWRPLLTTLALVFGVGMTASVAAVAGALRAPLLPVLKAERL